MRYMEQNATDDGFSLKQLFLRMVRQAVSHGRVPTVVNIDEQGQPYFATYRATNATNWKEATVEGRQDLVLAVFREFREKGDDVFSHDTEAVYRVYVLDGGVCFTEVQGSDGQIIEERRPLGTKKEDEWPFVAREFENRYRGYATRPSLEYPRWLPGIAEAQNSQAGQPVEPPVLIGDAVRAKLVLQNGSDTQRLGFQQLSDREMQEALAPSSPRRLQA